MVITILSLIQSCVMGYFHTFTICYLYSICIFRDIIITFFNTKLIIYLTGFNSFLYFIYKIIYIKNINKYYEV